MVHCNSPVSLFVYKNHHIKKNDFKLLKNPLGEKKVKKTELKVID